MRTAYRVIYINHRSRNGTERLIPILAMGRRPLIGTALLQDYHLSIDFCEGGTVLVDDIM
ncbi:MAG: hypothetical protein V7K25_13775 [Nostoc sp.]|uniref:hypothetical protein n=1 Tax=Nostoc sp. TaxID=1180 RepID=UPI002FF7519A